MGGYNTADSVARDRRTKWVVKQSLGASSRSASLAKRRLLATFQRSGCIAAYYMYSMWPHEGAPAAPIPASLAVRASSPRSSNQ